MRGGIVNDAATDGPEGEAAMVMIENPSRAAAAKVKAVENGENEAPEKDDPWEALVDSNTGRTYYHNRSTSTTRWEKPV
jgi:hypothetical protein